MDWGLTEIVGIQVVTGRWEMGLITEKWRWRRKVETRRHRKSKIKRAAGEEIE
jgi:hypothetical protein